MNPSLTANRPTAMKTNGVGRKCDWLNRDLGLAVVAGQIVSRKPHRRPYAGYDADERQVHRDKLEQHL